ncbi:MAG: saccharopine dehydrogenase NADP-binding domain-containing protein [Solirubrobacteraceae bacterium]
MIAVYGATGYTGRLVAAELERRGLRAVLSGRDSERLRKLAAEVSPRAAIRPAAVADRTALAAAFRGCNAVINCAGPFRRLGPPVVRAAIAAGCHYVDTSAEQAHIRNVFDTFSTDARHAGVSVVPATRYDIIPGDFIAHLTGTRVEPVERLVLGNGTPRFSMTRGSPRSTLVMMKGGDVAYEDGAWVKARRVRRLKLQSPETPSPLRWSSSPPAR